MEKMMGGIAYRLAAVILIAIAIQNLVPCGFICENNFTGLCVAVLVFEIGSRLLVYQREQRKAVEVIAKLNYTSQRNKDFIYGAFLAGTRIISTSANEKDYESRAMFVELEQMGICNINRISAKRDDNDNVSEYQEICCIKEEVFTHPKFKKWCSSYKK